MTHRWMRCWLAIGCLSGAAMLMAQSPASPARLGKAADTAAVRPRSSPTGAIVGRVADRRGQPQAGVAVTILRQDGKFVDKAYTQPDGQFRLGNLLPGLYAAEIAPPSFLPVWKSAIAVEPGAEYRLDISLLSLADSLEIGIPQDLKAASEDWKWTLRAAYPARPILRFEPANAAGKTLTDPRERALRGTVQFLAGNDSDGFGQDPGLRTAFDMAYALPASQQLAVAGFAGWERSTPAASMHAAWNRASAEGNSATLSVTVRQLFLPSEYWLTDAEVSAPTNRRVQSLTVGYEEEKVLGDRLRLHVGSLYDTLSFGRRMTRWSPFARLAYSPSETSRLTIAYTAANPRVLPAESERDSRVEEQVLAIPQISSDGASHPVLEGGSHVETQWEQQLTPSLRIQAAGFYDRLSQTAVSMAFAEPADFASSLLRDPFSDRYFLSAGGSASPGARVAVAARLSPRTELIVGYSYAGTVEAPSRDLSIADAAALRSALQIRSESSWTVKLRSEVPATRTQFTTSYRWLARNAVAVSDPYNHGWAQSRPFLNVLVLQPIPSPDILPGHFEAIADFNNLLAQGYVSVRSPNGAVGTLFPAPRSFRGGFNFIF